MRARPFLLSKYNDMNRTFTLLSLFLISLLTSASTVDVETARKVAEKAVGKPCLEKKVTLRRASTAQGKLPSYYLFTGNDGYGFALVSSMEEDAPLLGYSAETAISAIENMPDALKAYLDTYSKYMEACSNGSAVPRHQELPSLSMRRAADAAPLCKSSWGQGDPYNRLCPQIDGKRTIVGCVATAIAQIMNYWQWPVKGSGYGNGTDTNGEVIHGTLEHTYNWAAMKNTTAENIASDEAAAAVSQLSYDCGLAVGMKYGTGGSSAGTPMKAMYENFGYIPTTLRTQMRDCFNSDAEYLSVIADEIDAGRPVYQAATSQAGSGADAEGHAYVIDGYSSNGMVHVNWGWNGDFDGYFDLSKMNPSGYSFTINQRIMTGLMPAKNGETGLPVEFPYSAEGPTTDQKIGTTINSSVSFDVTLGSIYNFGSRTHKWTVTIGLYDTKNNFLKDLKTSKMPITVELESSYYIKAGSVKIPCKITGNYASGDYALRVCFKENNGDWILPDMAGGQKNNAIYVKIEGSNITFTDGSDYIVAGINSTYIHSDASPRYFDLQGREVPFTTKGLLIRKQGDTVRKVIIK